MTTTAQAVATATATVRNLRAGERLPEAFAEPLAHLPGLDGEWIWIVVDTGGTTLGMLAACCCHGLAMILRVKMLPAAPPTMLLRLLRGAFADFRSRGLIGYLSWYTESRIEEAVLRDIALRFGGLVVDTPTVGIASFLPPEGT